MASSNQSVKTRHKWTAAEKRELVSKLNKAKRGERTAILADFSERTGASPASVQAQYYAFKGGATKKASPAKKSGGAKRGGAKRTPAKRVAKKRTTPMERLAQQHSTLQANVAAAEKSLAQAQAALTSFETKLGRLA